MEENIKTMSDDYQDQTNKPKDFDQDLPLTDIGSSEPSEVKPKTEDHLIDLDEKKESQPESIEPEKDSPETLQGPVSTQGEIYPLEDLEQGPPETGDSTPAILPLEKEISFFKKTTGEIWQRKWQYIYLLVMSYLDSILRPLLFSLVVLVVYFGIQLFDLPASASSWLPAVNTALGFLGLLGVIWLTIAWVIGFLRSQISVILYVNGDESRDRKQIVKASKKHVWRLFKTQLLQGLIVLGGLFLFVIPGIVWSIKYIHAGYICVTTGKGARDSVRESGFLTHGYKWTIFYLGLCLDLFWAIISLIFSITFVLLVLLAQIGPVLDVAALVLVLLLLLTRLFVSLLADPYSIVFRFNIFQNNREKKTQNQNARGKISFWKILLVIILSIFLTYLITTLSTTSQVQEAVDSEARSVQLISQINPLGDTFDPGVDPGDQTGDEAVELTTLEQEFPAEEVGDEEIEVTPPVATDTIDSDRDGLGDSDELAQNTDPFLSDTDFDGLNDYEEVVVYQTDPLNKDTDGDGYPDGTEVESGYNPLGSGRLESIVVEQI